MSEFFKSLYTPFLMHCFKFLIRKRLNKQFIDRFKWTVGVRTEGGNQLLNIFRNLLLFEIHESALQRVQVLNESILVLNFQQRQLRRLILLLLLSNHALRKLIDKRVGIQVVSHPYNCVNRLGCLTPNMLPHLNQTCNSTLIQPLQIISHMLWEELQRWLDLQIMLVLSQIEFLYFPSLIW